jgi:hypothetical protein
MSLWMRATSIAGLFVATACSSSSSPPLDEADASTGIMDASEEFPMFNQCDPLGACDASLAMRVSLVFGSTCQGISGEQSCHGQGEAHLHLILGDGGDVVGVPSTERPDLLRVQPFDPTLSYLYLKLVGDGGIDGGRMPLDQAVFDPRYPELIGAWIEAGAPSP